MPNLPKTRLLELPYRADSLGYVRAVIDRPYPVLLSSAASPLGRYDIVSAQPAAVIALNEQVETGIADIATAIATYCSDGDTSIDLPFVAGAIGLLAYHAGEQLLSIPRSTAANDLRWPALHAGIYQWALVQDHQHRRCLLVADPKLAEARWQELSALLAGVKHAVNDTAAATATVADSFALTSDWQCSLPLPAYRERFAQLQAYIRAGDCYQANLTREFCANYRGDPWPLFGLMHKAAAAPFSAFLRRPEADLLSASPERFIHVDNAVATSQPIKGSRPRGHSASE
ncbi:MAG: chorismate-binding protein, partial [Pseudomonadales bacterium]